MARQLAQIRLQPMHLVGNGHAGVRDRGVGEWGEGKGERGATCAGAVVIWLPMGALGPAWTGV